MTGTDGRVANATAEGGMADALRDVASALGRMASPWMTVREAEAYAHVRHGAVQEAIMGGAIKAYRRTGTSQIVVRATEIDDWIERTWLASSCGFEGAQV